MGNPEPGVYGWTNQKGGVHFHRVAEPLRVARQRGIPTATGPALDNDVAERYDTILAHMLHDEHGSRAWEILAAKGFHRLVLDVDDLMWQPDFSPFRDAWGAPELERLFRNIRLAHVVTCPSAYLAEQIAPMNPNVHIVPNTVPAGLLAINTPRPYPDGAGYRASHERLRYVIGYQGSPSHSPDWPHWLMREMHGLITDLPLAWTLHFWGPDNIDGWPAHRVGHTPWQEIREYHRSVSMDIGLGPLKLSPFNRAKSALRAVEYAAIGAVAVLSDTEEYRRYVEHGVTGLLLSQGASWRAALRDLAADPVRVAAMGQTARERAAEWTTEANAHTWVAAWNSVGGEV